MEGRLAFLGPFACHTQPPRSSRRESFRHWRKPVAGGHCSSAWKVHSSATNSIDSSSPHVYCFWGLLGCDVANAHALHPFVCPCIRVCIHTFMIILARSLAFTHPAMKSRASRSANNRGLTDANAAPIRRRVLVAGSWGHSTSLSVITLVMKGCARCGQREFVHHRAVVPPIPIAGGSSIIEFAGAAPRRPKTCSNATRNACAFRSHSLANFEFPRPCPQSGLKCPCCPHAKQRFSRRAFALSWRHIHASPNLQPEASVNL